MQEREKSGDRLVKRRKAVPLHARGTPVAPAEHGTGSSMATEATVQCQIEEQTE